MQSDMTRAWVEVDLDAIRRNAALLEERAGVPLLPMVKADGYGLGAVKIARALLDVNPWGFGVATVAEGAELRASGITGPIVVFTPVLPDSLPALAEHALTPTLSEPDAIHAWGSLAGAPWHLAIDTGMARAGARWDSMDRIVAAAAAYPPEGAFTHLHSADIDESSIHQQEERFTRAVAALPARPRLLHVANSPGIVRGRRSRWDLVRPGIFLYGAGSAEDAQIRPEQVAQLRARIVEVRDLHIGESVSYHATFRATERRSIATAAIGYADGYRRVLSNRGSAIVNGARVSVVGRVTMDMVMLDVTDVPCVAGDVATFMGRDGTAILETDEVAAAGDLSPYELLAGLGARLPRLYNGDSS
jgi:alanine racemase